MSIQLHQLGNSLLRVVTSTLAWAIDGDVGITVHPGMEAVVQRKWVQSSRA